jgi:hypothetical protein
MPGLMENLLMRWDARIAPSPALNSYNVTPRQGRHTVRRKLLRQLQRRLDFQPPPALVHRE